MRRTSTPERRPEIVRFEVTLRTLLAAVAVGFGAWLLVQLWPVVLLVIVALILVGTLSPFVAWLERRRVRRGIAIGLVFLGIAGGAALVGALLFPPLIAQIAGLVDRAPALQAHAAELFARHRLTAPIAASIRQGASPEVVVGMLRQVVAYSPRILEVGTYALTALVLAIYLLLDRDRVRGALYAVTPRAYHLKLARASMQLETIVGGYVRGQVITSAAMTIVVFVSLTAFGVPNAVALAIFGGLADVIPYLGVFLTVIPAVLAGLVAKGPAAALAILAVLLVYEEIEGRVLIPRVYGRVLRLPSSAVIVALLIGGTLKGVLGALLALPIAAALRMLVHEFRVELPGETTGEEKEQVRKLDERQERAYAERTRGTPAEDAAAVALEMAEESRRADHRAAESAGSAARRGEPTERPERDGGADGDTAPKR